MERKKTMSQNVAHDFKTKTRTGDVLISENVDFAGLLLSDTVLAGLSRSGFKKPSPIQLKAIPIGRCGLDLIVQAKSGTGKTVVFTTIALESLQLESNSTQVLVLAPTREIAVQIWEVMNAISSEMAGIQCRMFIGGLPVNQDKQKLKHCHVAIGTPGRIKQLIENDMLKTESIRLFILDEADKLLEESFQEQINWIYSMLPDNKQMLALSATYPEYMAQQLTIYMRNPTFVRLNSEDPALLGIKQYFETAAFHPFPHIVFENKVKVLVKLLSSVSFHQCLVFSNLQARAQSLCDILNSKGWPSVCIAGCLEQEKRLQAMEKLKTFKCRVLISTDLTSRGIDAENVNLVVNLDLPHDHETYLHRIGRAGRFGSFGASIILVSGAEERDRLKTVEAKCNTCIYPLPDPIPADLADRDVPVRLGELVTATKIITRPEENVSSSRTEEESTSGDYSFVGNDDLCNLLQLDSSCASKTVTDRSSDRAGNLEKNDSGNMEKNDLQKKFTEKSVNYSLNSHAEVKTLMNDVGRKAEQEDVSGHEEQSSGCDLGECAVQENHANVEVRLLSEEKSSVGVMRKDLKETKGLLMNAEVQPSQNDIKLMRNANEEIAGSLKKNSEGGDKEIDTSKKKGRKKKKTSKTFLQEEFGGGESFQIFNTDMVLLERPGSSKERSSLPPPPAIPELKIKATFSSENILESTVKPSKSLTSFTFKQPVSSELPLSGSCSQNADTSKPIPGVRTGKDTPFKMDIHGRKKIVAVRRRKFGVLTNSYQKYEHTNNSNDGHSLHEKDLQEKNCFIDMRNQKMSVLSANTDSTVKSIAHCANEDHNSKLANGNLKSHTYSDALEDYENFLQTWDETSRIADAGDLVTLLVQKCKASKHGRSNGISREMVSKTLNDVKSSHITPFCNSNGSLRNLEEKSENDISAELKTLSLKDDHPHLATNVQSSSQTEQHVSSRSQISCYSEVTPKLNPTVGSKQQLEVKAGYNFVNSDSVSQASSSILPQQNSSQPEAVASLNETELHQAPVYSSTRGDYQCALSNPIVHRMSKHSPDQAITGKGHITAKTTSENSSSSISSDASSSSESIYDLDSDSESESLSLSEESLGNDKRFYKNEKSSCQEQYSGKNTFEDEREENIQYHRHGYNSFRTSRQYPVPSHYAQYPGYHNTTVPPGNPESFYRLSVPHRYNNQSYYPYAPPYPPDWSYPSWYAYYPNPYQPPPVHTSAYYPQCHSLSQYTTMNMFLKGDVEETDCSKMKKILKCQFDYLKYMKKS